ARIEALIGAAAQAVVAVAALRVEVDDDAIAGTHRHDVGPNGLDDADAAVTDDADVLRRGRARQQHLSDARVAGLRRQRAHGDLLARQRAQTNRLHARDLRSIQLDEGADAPPGLRVGGNGGCALLGGDTVAEERGRAAGDGRGGPFLQNTATGNVAGLCRHRRPPFRGGHPTTPAAWSPEIWLINPESAGDSHLKL